MTPTIDIPWAIHRRRLARTDNYWLATSRPDGRPHVAPLWGVWLDEALYFATDPESVKGRNLRKTPFASVHLDDAQNVLFVEGSVAQVADDDLVGRVDGAMADKYLVTSGRPYRLEMDPANLVWRLSPTRAMSWVESASAETLTRWVWNGDGEPAVSA